MSYPLMDTLNSAMFRLSLDELVDLERKRRCGMSRTEILSNIYCPMTTPPTPQKFQYLPNDRPNDKSSSEKFSSSDLKEHENNINAASRLFHLNLLSSATAVCVDGSKSSFWSNNSQCYVQQQKKLDGKKQDALRGVLEKALTQSFKPNEPQCIHSIKTYHGLSDSKKLDVNNKKNFIVVNHGVPIDPDYNILSEPKKVVEISKQGPRPESAMSDNLLWLQHATRWRHECAHPHQAHPISPNHMPNGLFSTNIEDRPSSTPTQTSSSLPPRLRRRRTKLIFRKTSAISMSEKQQVEDDWVCNHGPLKQNKIVQFAEISESKSQYSSSKNILDMNEPDKLTLAVSPRFNWKDVEKVETSESSMSEEQLARQLISLHRAVSHRDKAFLRQLMRRCENKLDMSLPLRGVTALSLSVYLKHNDMTSELLSVMKQTRQIGRAINLASVDNASRREPPIVTASRMGQLEIAALLAAYGADLEARDGQGRTSLWHAVREEQDDLVTLLIESGAKVFYRNEDLSCPMQLACKTALLKHKGRQMVKQLVQHGANIEFVDHALRNALYWSVYNCCSEITIFLLEAGARVKPWTWIQDDALPASFMQDRQVYNIVNTARKNPPKLFILARCALRNWLTTRSDGKSIIPCLKKLDLSEEMKQVIAFQKPVRQVSANKAAGKARKKLLKLCNETKV